MNTLLLRRNLMKDIPYQRVEYLESSGTQYINLLTVPQSSDIIQVDFKFTKTQSNIILGCRVSSASRKCTIGSGTQSTKIYASLGDSSNVDLAEFNTDEHTIIININNNQASIDGGNYQYVGTFSDSDLPLYLFACNQAGVLSFNSSARVKYVKISDRLELIPVRIGDTGYMYDKISGTLLGNSGEGSFILGPDIN